MKESNEYLEHDFKRNINGTVKLVNGFLSIGLFHYVGWILYQLFQWIF